MRASPPAPSRARRSGDCSHIAVLRRAPRPPAPRHERCRRLEQPRVAARRAGGTLAARAAARCCETTSRLTGCGDALRRRLMPGRLGGGQLHRLRQEARVGSSRGLRAPSPPSTERGRAEEVPRRPPTRARAWRRWRAEPRAGSRRGPAAERVARGDEKEPRSPARGPTRGRRGACDRRPRRWRRRGVAAREFMRASCARRAARRRGRGTRTVAGPRSASSPNFRGCARAPCCAFWRPMFHGSSPARDSTDVRCAGRMRTRLERSHHKARAHTGGAPLAAAWRRDWTRQARAPSAAARSAAAATRARAPARHSRALALCQSRSAAPRRARCARPCTRSRCVLLAGAPVARAASPRRRPAAAGHRLPRAPAERTPPRRSARHRRHGTLLPVVALLSVARS